MWALGYCKGSNSIAIGYDEGVVLLKVGKEEPVASMDSSGKVIWAKHSEVGEGGEVAVGGRGRANRATGRKRRAKGRKRRARGRKTRAKGRKRRGSRFHGPGSGAVTLTELPHPSSSPSCLPPCVHLRLQIQTVNIKALGTEYEMVDGERLPLAVKDLGSCDAYPQSLQVSMGGERGFKKEWWWAKRW